jgi:hypothetical protein
MESQNQQMPAPSALGHPVDPGTSGVRMVVLNPQQTQAITQGLDQLLQSNAAPLFPGEMLVGWQLRILPQGQVGVEVFMKRMQQGQPQPAPM